MAELERALPAATGPWDGLRVLVTAGGTREAIDPVRFIGNRSSGRMGLALAAAAARRGASVTLVAANVSLPTPPGVERIDVTSAAELKDACEREFDACHVLLMSAAVADFRPQQAHGGKIVREGSGGMSLELEATDDVLAGLAARRAEGQTLVGFAAEHGGEFVERARGKLERKGLDAIVVNDVSDASIGFDSHENEVTVVEADGGHPLPRGSKDDVAEAILDHVGDAARPPHRRAERAQMRRFAGQPGLTRRRPTRPSGASRDAELISGVAQREGALRQLGGLQSLQERRGEHHVAERLERDSARAGAHARRGCGSTSR